MPRKITLFRVVMERKLGIDWEHPDEEIEEGDSDEEQSERMSVHSLQTNQVVDGEYEGVETEYDEIQSHSNGNISILNVKAGGIGSLNPSLSDPLAKGMSFRAQVSKRNNLAQSSSNLMTESKIQKLNTARQNTSRTNSQQAKLGRRQTS